MTPPLTHMPISLSRCGSIPPPPSPPSFHHTCSYACPAARLTHTKFSLLHSLCILGIAAQFENMTVFGNKHSQPYSRPTHTLHNTQYIWTDHYSVLLLQLSFALQAFFTFLTNHAHAHRLGQFWIH